MYIDTKGNETTFRIDLIDRGAPREIWEQIERKLKRTFNQIVSVELSLRNGNVKITANMGALEERSRQIAIDLLQARCRNLVDTFVASRLSEVAPTPA